MKIADKTGSVYVILNLELPRVKIGFSNNPEKRLMSLSTQGGCKLRLCYYTPPITDYKEVEAKMHDYFRDVRIRGEWFNLSPEEAIKKLKTLVDSNNLSDIVKMYNEGYNVSQISRKKNCSRAAIIKHLKAYGVYNENNFKAKGKSKALNALNGAMSEYNKSLIDEDEVKFSVKESLDKDFKKVDLKKGKIKNLKTYKVPLSGSEIEAMVAINNEKIKNKRKTPRLRSRG